MTWFRLPQLVAAIFGRNLGATCTAFFLCCSAAAQSKPPELGRPGPARAGAQTQASAEQLSRSLAQIEAVGFRNRMEGPRPVALFHSGDALFEIHNLLRATSVEADRAEHPKDWGRWKRAAGGIEVLEGGQWAKLSYPKTMQPLPAGFALSGEFEHLVNSVTPDSNLGAQFRYSFRPDGRFSSNRFVGVSADLEHYPVVTAQSRGPALEGRYHVDGYLIRLEPAGGKPETHLICTYPGSATIIWIDGSDYTKRK